ANRTALALITNMLGGPALNSRLNVSIREKAGLAYTVEANYTVYSDSGLFQIYFGTDTTQVARCTELIDKELNKFRTQALSSAKLKAAVRQLEGQLLLNRENKLSVLTNLARQVLLFDRIETPEAIQKRLLALTPVQLQDVSQHLFHPNQLSRLSFLG
ncbi:MAG: M16 family metallopeptidase, partial [Bacteroidia bacterium]